MDKEQLIKLENFLQFVMFWTGVVLIIMGFLGAILVILSSYRLIRDEVLQAAFTFVSFYMFFTGLFLIAYHKKILVRPKNR